MFASCYCHIRSNEALFYWDCGYTAKYGHARTIIKSNLWCVMQSGSHCMLKNWCVSDCASMLQIVHLGVVCAYKYILYTATTGWRFSCILQHPIYITCISNVSNICHYIPFPSKLTSTWGKIAPQKNWPLYFQLLS